MAIPFFFYPVWQHVLANTTRAPSRISLCHIFCLYRQGVNTRPDQPVAGPGAQSGCVAPDLHVHQSICLVCLSVYLYLCLSVCLSLSFYQYFSHFTCSLLIFFSLFPGFLVFFPPTFLTGHIQRREAPLGASERRFIFDISHAGCTRVSTEQG